MFPCERNFVCIFHLFHMYFTSYTSYLRLFEYSQCPFFVKTRLDPSPMQLSEASCSCRSFRSNILFNIFYVRQKQYEVTTIMFNSMVICFSKTLVVSKLFHEFSAFLTKYLLGPLNSVRHRVVELRCIWFLTLAVFFHYLFK